MALYRLELALMGDITSDILAEVRKTVECLNLEVVQVWKCQPLQVAFNLYRSQYVADKLLEHVARYNRRSVEGILLLIADVDAYVYGLNFVFGVALPPLNAAAVFLPRLRYLADSTKFRERVRKEVLHELGHVFGLEHCNVSGCVMNFSNSVLEVDTKKPAFCWRCASKLRLVGIDLNPSCML